MPWYDWQFLTTTLLAVLSVWWLARQFRACSHRKGMCQRCSMKQHHDPSSQVSLSVRGTPHH